ncbi:MAG TPA: pitrilysin family protein [Blastocatellia bacterium]|nr:pitrilysin family protein [Blastocatellia bacterium]
MMNRNRRWKTLLVLLCALFTFNSAAVNAQSPALPQGVQRVTSVEGITEYRLPNGLRVLLFPDQSKQTITVNITYLVGSKHENYGETGMAHLLEHLVFKGTPKHPNIPQELTEHGTRPNGSTWFDRTNYFETFAATDENLKWALDLEADRMINSYIAKKDLDSEMTVVRNELEMGENEPFRVLFERVFSTAYLWHNYGKSTIGAKADLENVPIDRLQAFYKRFYQPDNAVLIVAGKFDEPKTLALVHQYFAPIPKPTRELQKLYTTDPTQDGERTVTVRRVGDTQMLMAGYHIPAGSHPDAAPISILMQVLADTPSGRLHKSLVEAKKAASVFALPYIFGEPSLLLLGAEVRSESPLPAAQETFLQVVEEIAKTPITKDEVERARGNLLKQIQLNMNNSEQICLELSEWIGMGDWRLMFLNRDGLRKVSVEDVQRVANTYLKQSNRTLGLFIPTPKPDRAEIPATPDVLALVKDYKGDALVAEGEAFDPSPANIDARTVRATSPSGIKTAFLTKKTRGNTVVARMTLRMGDEKSLMNRATAGSLTGDMLMRGTKTKTRQQIQDEFDKLKARVAVSGGPTSAGVTIETTRQNFPAVLKLVAEILREPAFPAAEFEQLKQEQLAGIEQQRSEPTTIAATAFQRHTAPYPKGHVNYVSTPEEDVAEIKAATLEDVKKFHADFYGASFGEFTAIGDFDEKETAKLLQDLFGNWKNKMPYTRIPSPFKNIPAVTKSFEAPDKANAFFIAGMNLNLRDDDPDYPALVLGNYMLGGGFLNSRLAVRIRQRDGLSYGVGSQLSAAALDQSGQFVSFAIYAPQNVTKLEAAFKEEIARMLKDGFTAEEIEKAKSGWLQSRQVSRAQDNELAGTLNNTLFLNRTMAWAADLDKKVMALTSDQILTALRKYIDPNKISIFKAGDFAKSSASK